MHGISSKAVTGGVQLGPILTTLVEVEGVAIEALLDTGSPVTIIELESLLQIFSKTTESKSNTHRVESRSGGSFGTYFSCVTELQWGQTPGGLTDSSYSQSFRVLYKSSDSSSEGAPVKLLIGTDLLSKLGYLFVQASQTGNDNDMLNDTVLVSDNKRDVVPQETRQNVEGTGEVKSSSLESGATIGGSSQNIEDSSRSGTVCLIQATRIPARHQKLVRAEVKGVSFGQQNVTLFEPNMDKLEDSFLSAPEALICLDTSNNCTLVLENHGCEPVYQDKSWVNLGM